MLMAIIMALTYNDVVRMIIFLPSVASTAMVTSLFASLMADGGIIVERFPLGSGSFLIGLISDIATLLQLHHMVNPLYTLKIMHYILQK